MADEEDLDFAAESEEEALERGEAIVGSYLRRYVCTVCLKRVTLATVEHAVDAICGQCLAGRTGYGAPDGSVPFSPVIGYRRGTEESPYRVVAETVPHPAPIVSSRDPMPPGVVVPAPVSSLAAEARSAGWRTVVQYAMGRGVHMITGKPTALAPSFGVRMAHRNGCHAVAVYAGGSSWTWKSVWIFSETLAPFGKAGVTELKEYLALAGEVSPAWFRLLASRRAGQEAAKKQKAACDVGKHEGASTVMMDNKPNMHCPHCGNMWLVNAAPWRKPKKAREHS